MAAHFFFGTLRHLPLLEVVLGRPPRGVAAGLADHAVHWVRDEPFPVLTPAPGAVAPGLLVTDLSAEEVARLDYYEGGFDYATRPVTVEGPDGPCEAMVYFTPEGRWPLGAPWSLADWAAGWGAVSTEAAREVMARRGRYPAEAVGRMLPFFRARAWGRQRLAPRAAPQSLRRAEGMAEVDYRPLPGAYEGFFRLQPFALSHPRFDGSRAGPLERECFVAWDVALVLPYDPQSDRVLLIEQLRYGPILRGDPAPWVLEPVAGVIDAGETPEQAARREAREEAGLRIETLLSAPGGYASPGYSTEFCHCFLGLADLEGRDSRRAGVTEEGEDIRSHVLGFEEAMALVRSGEINALPLVMLLSWLAVERPGLRGAR
jgi:nudix-type nucleoside diphosphatase (YffH/AdpP family)